MPIGRHPPQPSLFDVPAVNAARDQGMTTVAEHAERVRPSFTEDALKFVVEYLRAHEPTSGEVLTLKCKLAGIVPHDDRAFGPIYYALSRRGVIVKVGSVRRERGHGTSGGIVWALRR